MKNNYNLQCKTLIITAFASLAIISILIITIIYQHTVIDKLKDSKTSKFFVEAKFTKEQKDTTTLSNLKFLIEDKNIPEEDKRIYIAKYADLVINMNNQSRIETILKAKGYEDSIVFINDDRATVIIKSNKDLKRKQLNEIRKVIDDITGIKAIEIMTKGATHMTSGKLIKLATCHVGGTILFSVLNSAPVNIICNFCNFR